MKLYERFGDRGFHSTIITTFGIDFDAYENIALARLRGSGCHNNILIADNRMLAHALSGASPMPQYAGRYYSVLGASASGVFHPKIIFQLGRQQGRMIIGSANVTASGLAGNLEVAGVIECGIEDSGAQRLIAAGWAYLSRVLDREHRALTQQIAWLEARTPWLMRTEPATGAVNLADNSVAAFLGSRESSGIMDRFVGLISDSNIERLVVLSPYWDADLGALRELVARLLPKKTLVLVAKDQALFPAQELKNIPGVEVRDIGTFAEERFVHAKLFIASTEDADHILFGSANCTVAALGRAAFVGSNDEVCLYRRLSPGIVSETLGIEKVIAEATIVDLTEFPEFDKGEEIPLDEMVRRQPGHFECLFDTLIWRPPGEIDVNAVAIELWNATGQEMPCPLRQLDEINQAEIRFEMIEIAERPAFAIVRFPDGSYSTPAVVALVDALRGEARETRSNKTEKAAVPLGEETEEGLWLLEILDDLEDAEAERKKESIAAASVRKKRIVGTDDTNCEYQTLDYAKFVAGRRLRSEASSVGRNSLSGTEVSLVRAFLNRVLAIGVGSERATNENDDSDLRGLFDFGDEIADAHDAIEGGSDFGTADNVRSVVLRVDRAEADLKRALRQKTTRDQIEKAVTTFIKNISDRSKIEKLNSFDILRLRAILTIVIASGYVEERTQGSPTALQVFPVGGGDDHWPRLLGRVLFLLFGGTTPAIQRLEIEDIFDRIPDDLVETWACCIWAACAGLSATARHPRQSRINSSFVSLLKHIYVLTGLQKTDLLGDAILAVMQKLSDRFDERLGLDTAAIVDVHKEHLAKFGDDRGEIA